MIQRPILAIDKNRSHLEILLDVFGGVESQSGDFSGQPDYPAECLLRPDLLRLWRSTRPAVFVGPVHCWPGPVSRRYHEEVKIDLPQTVVRERTRTTPGRDGQKEPNLPEKSNRIDFPWVSCATVSLQDHRSLIAQRKRDTVATIGE